jgi:uncharacterized protein (DUF302 family)
MRKSILATAMALLAASAAAETKDEGAHVYAYDGPFEEATFAVESAIIGKGLVIDYVSHPGEMLNRTGADVGSDVKLFEAADIYIFCSAVLSRKVMEADPMNLAHCPYGIFVVDWGGEVVVGYRDYPAGVMDEVEALLDSIVKEALSD